MSFGFEKSFIQRLLQQDKPTFTDFYIQTVDVFFRYLISRFHLDEATAKDITASFYVKFWELLPQYDHLRNFDAFVWTMFKNLTKDYFKKHSMYSFTEIGGEEESFEDSLADGGPSVQEFLQMNYTLTQIQEALAALDGESRDIVHFKFIEGKTYQEVATMLGLTVGNVRKKMSRILQKLLVRLQHLA